MQQQSLARVSSNKPQEIITAMTRIFDNYIDFLRNSKKFPNRDVNDLTTLMWRLIGNRDIPLILDQWQLPAFSFIILSRDKNIDRIPLYVLPQNFLELVRRDAVM